MMNKTEIRVTIDSEEKQKRAIEILEKHREVILDDFNGLDFDDEYNSLKFYEDWYIGKPLECEIEITLDQLDELLTKEKQK